MTYLDRSHPVYIVGTELNPNRLPDDAIYVYGFCGGGGCAPKSYPVTLVWT
jgi:hypothetical protein